MSNFLLANANIAYGGSMNSKPMVHIVDDDEAFRTSLLRLLRGHDFDVKTYASTGDFLLHRPSDRYGCILLDIRLPGPSGIELHAVLREQGVYLPVIFITGHAEVDTCVAAMKAGAVDYLEKPIEPEAILNAIGRALDRDGRERALRGARDALQSTFSSLSQRERQIFDLIIAGRLNKQIADDLGIAERTVKAQRASLMEKLGVKSAAGLGRFAEKIYTDKEKRADYFD
ncbi:response regulator transcription factor [Labrys miyagiensis]|nr:response regulator [Labrys miyagiensis]